MHARGKGFRASLYRLADWLALERNVAVMVTAVLVITMGGELWSRFVPKYLEAIGASAVVIGLYGSLKNILNAVYQYPGGVLADKLGPRRALVLFSLVAVVGYLIYFLSTSWEAFLLGTFLVLAWDSMSQPAIFSLIGESLGRSRRAMGFSIQSILRRVPIVIAPPLGGLLISKLGLIEGVKVGFLTSAVLAVAAAYLQHRLYRPQPRTAKSRARITELWPGGGKGRA